MVRVAVFRAETVSEVAVLVARVTPHWAPGSRTAGQAEDSEVVVHGQETDGIIVPAEIVEALSEPDVLVDNLPSRLRRLVPVDEHLA